MDGYSHRKLRHTTMCIVHASFKGFWVLVALKKYWCYLIGNHFVIPHDTIHSTLTIIADKSTLI